jgi:phage shock protein PspC (stress-responsive transcriptional regulator)
MEIEMQDAQLNVETHEDITPEPDTLFGVCQTIGNELGFDPFYLRIALLGLLFFSPVAVIASYVALGAAVALSTWLFPKPHAETEVTPQVAVVEPAADETREPELLAA